LLPKYIGGLLSIAYCVAAAGQDFMGAQTCGECHALQRQPHSASRHANALRPIRESRLPGLMTAQTLLEPPG
jgi:hypothetical protein